VGEKEKWKDLGAIGVQTQTEPRDSSPNPQMGRRPNLKASFLDHQSPQPLDEKIPRQIIAKLFSINSPPQISQTSSDQRVLPANREELGSPFFPGFLY
jgi:hypothetical protein